jgi:hypothetical protein
MTATAGSDFHRLTPDVRSHKQDGHSKAVKIFVLYAHPSVTKPKGRKERLKCNTTSIALQRLLERQPDLAGEFQAIRQGLKTGEVARQHEIQLGLLDGIIAQLRGT